MIWERKPCGGPVGLVYHAPDAIWEAATGYERNQVVDGMGIILYMTVGGARRTSGQSAPGILCPKCLSDLAKEAGLPFLCWTCATDDSVLVG